MARRVPMDQWHSVSDDHPVPASLMAGGVVKSRGHDTVAEGQVSVSSLMQ